VFDLRFVFVFILMSTQNSRVPLGGLIASASHSKAG
jgi:hypothetical protein